jgi:serpin B
MRHVARYRVSEDDALIAVELPYAQGDLAMLLLVPHDGGFEAVDSSLSVDRIERIVSRLRDEWVDLQLPRFAFETGLALGPALSAMGLGKLLSPAADLSGISAEPGFHVSEVVHKTFIDVEERGTEAAAATGSVMLGGAFEKPLALHVNRPFHLLIRDTPTGVPLFFGRVLDPR